MATTKNLICTDDNFKDVVRSEIDRLGSKADLNHLNTTLVTNMKGGFTQLDFVGNISEWDTSNVENMESLFGLCSFNGNISKWDVSNVKNMKHLFYSSDFNQDISEWKIDACVNTSQTFTDTNFTGEINKYRFGVRAEQYNIKNGVYDDLRFVWNLRSEFIFTATYINGESKDKNGYEPIYNENNYLEKYDFYENGNFIKSIVSPLNIDFWLNGPPKDAKRSSPGSDFNPWVCDAVFPNDLPAKDKFICSNDNTCLPFFVIRTHYYQKLSYAEPDSDRVSQALLSIMVISMLIASLKVKIRNYKKTDIALTLIHEQALGAMEIIYQNLSNIHLKDFPKYPFHQNLSNQNSFFSLDDEATEVVEHKRQSFINYLNRAQSLIIQQDKRILNAIDGGLIFIADEWF